MLLASVLCAGAALATAAESSSFEASPYLPPAPRGGVPELPDAAVKSVVIDPLSRSDVARAYQQVYLPQATVAPQWTGNVAACVAGSTAGTYRTAVMERINFHRALAGLSGIVVQTSDPAIAASSQAAALMMSAEGSLSHSPGAGWACYSSAGASGAASSNLALGRTGPAAIDLYIDDPGPGNSAVGHRRWILFPPQQTMSTGDIPSGTLANALYVFGPAGPRPSTPDGVAWPPRGFVPYQVLPAMSNRWSLSFPNADFSAATVSMTMAGQPVATSIESRTANGYGDNTLVWRPSSGSTDANVVYGAAGVNRRYEITVANIAGIGVPASISYGVTVIDGTEAASTTALFADGFE